MNEHTFVVFISEVYEAATLPAEAAQLMRMVSGIVCKSGCPDDGVSWCLDSPRPVDHKNLGLLSLASQTAQESLDKLVGMYPLGGPASRYLGTALRVPCVRQRLQEVQLRGTSLLQWLRWTSAAADANRHLTCTILQEIRMLVCDLGAAQETAEDPYQASVGQG